MLAPVYRVLFAKNGKESWLVNPSLELTEDQIAISYKTYKSNRAVDRQTIIDESLTPGKMTNTD